MDQRSKVCKQVIVQRNGAQVLLESESKSYTISLSYSNCIRFLLADVIAIRIGIANDLGFIFIF